jgi:predicted metal-dependent peptidase
MAVNRKLAEARILAAKKMPYMRHSVMSLVPVLESGLGTMAVDEYARLYYDPAFLETRDLGHLAFVVLHECIHVYGKHSRRARRLLGDKPAKDRLGVWRKAVDASVNDILEQSGLPCPEEGITPGKLGLPKNKTPEEYFDLLCKRQEEQEQAAQEAQKQQQQAQTAQDDAQDDPGDQGDDSEEGQPDNSAAQDDATEGQDGQDEPGDGQSGDDGQPGDEAGESGQDGDGQGQGDGDAGGQGDGEGSGSGTGTLGNGDAEGESQPSAAEIGGSSSDGQSRPWELGEPTPDNPGMAEHEQNLIEAATAKAIEEQIHSRGKGSVANALAKQAGELLHPVVDPTRELASRVKYAVDCISGFGGWSYRKPNRRQPAVGALLPAHTKPIPRVTVVIDTSGSMNSDDLAKALEVLGNALRNLPDPRGLRVLVGGTRVEQAKNVFRQDQIELLEGGGTDMAAMIVAAAEERPAPKAIVVVTDGETGWPSEPVKPMVVVALTRKPRWMSMPPEWCDTVLLNPEEE